MADPLVTNLRAGVSKLVAQIFPRMVAAELVKLTGGRAGQRTGMKEEILKLHKAGLRNCEIALKLNTQASYVSKVISVSKNRKG